MALAVERTIKLSTRLKIYLYFRRILFFLTFSLLVFGRAFAASQNKHASHQYTGFKKYIKNYSQEDIGLLGQNRYILQDKRGIIYVGNFNDISKGGSLQEFDGEKERQFKNITQYIESIVEDKKGNLWVGLVKKGVLKVDFPGDGTISFPVVTAYHFTQEFADQGTAVSMAAGHVMFNTVNGLFRFDEKNKAFIPDLTLGNKFAGGSKRKGFIWPERNENLLFLRISGVT